MDLNRKYLRFEREQANYLFAYASRSDSGYQSPQRHHHRMSSAQRTVKETHNAHSEYSQSSDDGASQLRINQYLIRQEIGRGSFGAVHLATDQYDKEYAVKEFSKTRLRRRAQSNLLRRSRTGRVDSGGGNFPAPLSMNSVLARNSQDPKSPTTSNSFDLIREEIAVMKKLNHSNLVSLIEVLDDPEDDSLFMVLDYCHKGVVMKIEVDEDVDPYETELCRMWFRDLMLGIEYLHAQGIVHRDIKPDNCLLTHDDTLKVVDFGVSEMFERQSDMKIHKTAGSPAFQAPELCQVKGGDVEGRPADIWSMGITLYCLRFGRVPFRKGAVLDLYQSIINDPLEIPEGCEPELEDLLRRILEKDPEERISMEQLREHSWVTKGGEDPLLSAEENCSEIVSAPTEQEMDAAITHNMGRVLAVMKAAKRFKSLIERNRPRIMDSILGQASRIVKPPLSMMKTDHRLNDVSAQRKSATDRDLETAKVALRDQGDSKSAELISKLDKLPSRIKSAVVSPTDNSPELPESPHKLRKVQTDPPDAEIHAERARGHAHNPLEDEIYLNIGRGPIQGDAGSDPPDHQVVCESPPAADLNLFEKAYENEVDTIYSTRGHSATVYLTRRVEKKMQDKLPQLSNKPAGATTDPSQSSFGNLVGRVTGSEQATKSAGGLANLVGKAYDNARGMQEGKTKDTQEEPQEKSSHSPNE